MSDTKKNFINDAVLAYDLRHFAEEFKRPEVIAALGLKYDDEKPRTDLISSIAMEEIGKVLAYGAVKYGPNNWRKGIAWGRLVGAVLRHLFAWMRGEDRDLESGLPHLSHALTTLMMLVEFQHTRRDLDDRWREKEVEK